MKRVAEDILKRAESPWEIFSRDLALIEEEKEEYLERFKPKEYKKIENYIAQQKIILLYRKAMEELENLSIAGDHTLIVKDVDGKEYRFDYMYSQEHGVCQMLTTKNHVVFVVPQRYESYYQNYIDKCNFKLHISRGLWENVKYSLPNVVKTFKTDSGDFIIIVKKPHSMIYPLTSILEYFDGRIDPKYVASIMTRLYETAMYCDLRGFSHNGLTVENLFFSPGRRLMPDEPFTVEDVRIVGVFGGWFFSTNNNSIITGKPNDKIIGLPRKIKEILPQESKDYHYGSYKIDMLSIKQVSRELLGDITGKNLGDIPEPFAQWLNSTSIAPTVYDEKEAWKEVRKSSFGKPEFIEMHLSQ